MDVSRNTKIAALTELAALVLTAAAQAGSNAPALRALAIRGQAMNDRYDLDALNAEAVRSDALNRRYHLGAYANGETADNTAALRALAIRGQRMNAQYHLGTYAVVRQPSNGFDWTDASIGGAFVLCLITIGSGVAVGRRRLRSERLRPA